LELSLSGEVADGLRFIGGLSILDAKLRQTAGGTNDDDKAVGVPNFSANANVEWDVGGIPSVTLTGRVVQTGTQPVNVSNTLEIKSWARFDLRAHYVFAAADNPVTQGFTVDNVGNKRYGARYLMHSAQPCSKANRARSRYRLPWTFDLPKMECRRFCICASRGPKVSFCCQLVRTNYSRLQSALTELLMTGNGRKANLAFGIREGPVEHRNHTPPILANCTTRDPISKCQLRN